MVREDRATREGPEGEMTEGRTSAHQGVLEEANTLYHRVKGTYEATLDARLLVLTADTAASRVRGLRLGEEIFDGEALARKIVKFGGGDLEAGGTSRKRWRIRTEEERDDDQGEEGEEEEGEREQDGSGGTISWSLLGNAALECGWTRVSGMEGLLGAITPQALGGEGEGASQRGLPRAKRNRRELGQGGNEAPEVVTTMSLADLRSQRSSTRSSSSALGSQAASSTQGAHAAASDTTKHVSNLYRILKHQPGPVSFFRLVCNPLSFGQTIENIFHLSFLVRDGRVDIHLPEEGEDEATVRVREPPTHEDYEEGLEKKQLVLPLDPPLWRELCQAYNLVDTPSLIPHREEPSSSQGEEPVQGSWY